MLKQLLMRWRGLSCHEALELLQSYLDGEISEDEAREVASHLDRCTRCDHELGVYRTIKASLGGLDQPIDAEVLESLERFGKRVVNGEIGA